MNKLWRINKRHKNSIIEEVTKVRLEARNENEAIRVAEKNGFVVVDTNPVLNIILVQA